MTHIRVAASNNPVELYSAIRVQPFRGMKEILIELDVSAKDTL